MRGGIVNAVSHPGQRGRPDMPRYCAAKVGIIGFTKSLAHAHARQDIRSTPSRPARS